MNREILLARMRALGSSIATRWDKTSNRGRAGVIAVMLALLCIFLLPLEDTGDNDIIVDSADTVTEEIVHTVVQGDSIIGTIAPAYGVQWQAIALVNEQQLANVNAERCGKLSKRYTQNARRRGHYCKSLMVDGRQMMDLNSLQPGDTLRIPLTTHPVVDEVIASIPGSSIAIVIDDTGSMMNDRAQVSAWYMRSAQELGKSLTTVILYADGHVREFSNTGGVTFTTTGNMENTRHALEVAASSNPSAIVLVSDEPGDDWNEFEGLNLPPVYAHSLDGISHENLRHVAELSGGAFMRPPLQDAIASN